MLFDDYNDYLFGVNVYVNQDTRNVEYDILNSVFIHEKDAMFSVIEDNTYMYLSGTYDFWPQEYRRYYDTHGYLRYDSYVDLLDYITLKHTHNYIDTADMFMPVGYHYFRYDDANDVIRRELELMFDIIPHLTANGRKTRSQYAMRPGDRVDVDINGSGEFAPRRVKQHVGRGILDRAKTAVTTKARDVVAAVKSVVPKSVEIPTVGSGRAVGGMRQNIGTVDIPPEDMGDPRGGMESEDVYEDYDGGAMTGDDDDYSTDFDSADEYTGDGGAYDDDSYGESSDGEDLVGGGYYGGDDFIGSSESSGYMAGGMYTSMFV